MKRTRSQNHAWLAAQRRSREAQSDCKPPVAVAVAVPARPRTRREQASAADSHSPPSKRVKVLLDGSALSPITDKVERPKPDEVPMCRSLRYEDTDKAPEDHRSTLQRICAGQWLQDANSVVGREEEKRKLRALFNGEADGSGCLFLVGPPGTGKTSTVNEVLRQCELSTSRLRAVRVNCSTFASPTALYADIARRLTAQRGSSRALPSTFNALALDAFLCQATTETGIKNSNTVALVLDEVDHLLRLPKRQQLRVREVLRFLVQWSSLSSSLKFVGIMNGIDMYSTIRQVLGSPGQDVDVPHIVFAAYKHAELLCILESYARGARQDTDATSNSAVDARALELIARKIAARDGDARRAVSLLQQSARSALNRPAPSTSSSSVATAVAAEADDAHVGLRDVMQSSSDMLSSPLAKQIAQLPRLPKLLLYVLTTLAPSNGKAKCDLNTVSDELARLRTASSSAGSVWLPQFSREELVRHVTTLECYALIKRDHKRGRAPAGNAFWTAKLCSAATMADVARALRGDEVLSRAMQLVSSS